MFSLECSVFSFNRQQECKSVKVPCVYSAEAVNHDRFHKAANTRERRDLFALILR